MVHKVFRKVIFCYIFTAIGLFVYSYTQVDLGLTLSEAGIMQMLQKNFQYVGYFQRPTSTALYLLLVSVLFLLYFWMLSLIKKGTLKRQHIWTILFAVTFILIFSYPAFSYDIFNYLFTAKTVMLYQKNPYIVYPLQLSGVDSWLGFMHWTHLPSVYSPIWISLTLLPYILSFGSILLALVLLKTVLAVFYLGCAWFIEKSLEHIEPNYSLVGLVIFALNPIVIIESLVSSHNDIVMVAFALGAYYWYTKKETLLSFFILSVSIAFKFLTIFWLPIYFVRWKREYLLLLTLVILGVILMRREMQGWYLLLLYAVVSLLPKYTEVYIMASGIALGMLLRYAPFLYYGDWNQPVGLMKTWVTVIPIMLSVFWILAIRFVSSSRKPIAVR